ncbi:MAG TPA: glycosyl hydrolase family 28-related protein, partial [Nitrolancea sp.]|nr:glycosyl hydrolase family 28-related protein [Nitrolancea sp.]
MKKLCAFVACLLVPSWAQSQTVVDSFTAPLALPLGGTGTTSSYGMANAVGTTGLVSFSGTLSVTGAANNGSGAIRLTVPTAHLYTGGLYTVAGVGGVTNANGEWRFTIIDGTHADLGSSTFAGSYTGGGTVTAAAGYTTTVWSPSSCADSTINLPASPGDNEPHTIINAGNCPSNGLIISGNGHNIGTASGIVSIAPGPVAVRYSVSAGAVWTSSFAAGQLLPSEFGAVADGTTDDTSALQDAINASCRSGLPVNLAGGTYEITQSLLGCSNLTIRGPGTIFLPNADFDCQDSVSCRYASNAVGL